jgi:hypothetical protein
MTRKAVVGALAVVGATFVAGCGSSHTARTAATTTTAAVPQTVVTSQSAAEGTAPAEQPPATTRTEEAPAFAQQSASSSLPQAERVVEGAGYVPAETAGYRTEDALRVIIGRRMVGSIPQEQAFFFLDRRFLGTDASQPSQSLSFVSATESTVTLSYGIYQPSDPPCCPASRQTVTFALNNGSLTPQQPLPPLSARR